MPDDPITDETPDEVPEPAAEAPEGGEETPAAEGGEPAEGTEAAGVDPLAQADAMAGDVPLSDAGVVAGAGASRVPATKALAAGAAPRTRPQRPPMQAMAVSFAPVAEAGEKADTSIDFLFDIPVQVTVRLGETRILVRDLLQLGQGSVVELDKLAGEPLEVVVNNKLMARGEVVVVNEKFGIRLTDVVTPAERIHSLK